MLSSREVGEEIEKIDLELDGDKWIAFQVLITERMRKHDPDSEKTILEVVSSMSQFEANNLLNEIKALNLYPKVEG